MKKKIVSILVCAAMLVALAAGCGSEQTNTPDGSGDAAGNAAEPEVTLVVTQHDPEESATGQFLNAWAAEVEEKSEGRIDIDIKHGGVLAGAKDSLDYVTQGSCDIAWGLQSFYSGTFPASEVFMLPMLDIECATQGSAAFWDVYTNTDYLDAEYEEWHVLFLHTNCQSPISTVDKKIEKVSDMKGMALRGNSGPPADFINALGATAQACPITELFTNLQKGVYAGCVTDWHGIESFGLDETIAYYLDANVGVSTYFMLMNWDKYNAMPEDLQKILDDVSADSAKHTEAWDIVEKDVKAQAEAAGKLVVPSEELMAELNKVADDVTKAWIDKTENGQEIYDAAVAAIEAAK